MEQAKEERISADLASAFGAVIERAVDGVQVVDADDNDVVAYALSAPNGS